MLQAEGGIVPPWKDTFGRGPHPSAGVRTLFGACAVAARLPGPELVHSHCGSRMGLGCTPAEAGGGGGWGGSALAVRAPPGMLPGMRPVCVPRAMGNIPVGFRRASVDGRCAGVWEIAPEPALER